MRPSFLEEESMFLGSAVTVGSSATLLISATRDMEIKVTTQATNEDIAIGDSLVTTSNGFPLIRSASANGPALFPNFVTFRVKEGDSVYAITAASNKTVYILATSSVEK